MITRIVLFLILNFSALAIGGLFTGQGVASEWYANLNKAPWTPPGWVFGAAWTTIMICFTVYMAYLWPSVQNKKLVLGLFIIQWILNVIWNPVFFSMHNSTLGLIIITALTVLVGFMLIFYHTDMIIKSLFLLPYFLWLLIATSLNAYVLFKN